MMAVCKYLCCNVCAFLAAKQGATAIEYGIIVGGVAIAIVAALFATGDSLGGLFGTLEAGVENVTGTVEIIDVE